jgi:Tim10/DDP family zinc finger
MSSHVLFIHLYSLRMYNSLVERCFKECVDSFRKKDLDNTEEKVGLFSHNLNLCHHHRQRPQPSHHLFFLLFSPFSALQCVSNCCEKFMKHSARVGMRFGELSAAAESQMQQVVQGQTGK